jgi:hypothetical protein
MPLKCRNWEEVKISHAKGKGQLKDACNWSVITE